MNFNLISKSHSLIQPKKLFLIIIILFGICNVTFSQGRRDRISGNVNYNRVGQTDTSSVISAEDSLKLIEAREPVDSTARIKYFTYEPEYFFGTKLKGRTSPILLGNSAVLKPEITFDTSGNVILTENFNGEPIRAPLVIPLDTYLQQLSENNRENIFSDIVSEYFRGGTQDDLGKLFEKFTDITIPLPFKSESIFGPPTFNLKLNGAVDITASYQSAKSDQTIITGLSNVNNSINFKQEVQLTAKGKVGDKLSIDADYNTQRLFDFENQLRLKYEGYADEVIKKIEGGNVSLETRSGLIGSSQSLFGVKGDFQLGALSLSAVVSQKKSKTETKDYSGGAQEQRFDIKVWDYSDNHFFLDTTYKSSFIDFYTAGSSISLRTDSLTVDEQSFEVWVQTDLQTTGYRRAAMYIDLPNVPQGGRYDDSLKTVNFNLQGRNASGIVRKLETSEYKLNRIAGYVSLNVSLPENYFIGVAYKRTKTQEQFGTISTDSGNAQDTLILKMIKPENLVPANTLAWEHKLKNIYRLPVSRIVQEGFEFEVKYLDNGNYIPTLPPSQNISRNLIFILGLDRYTNGRSGEPDNKFDFIPGTTIDVENGYVIFPTLKPFLSNLSTYTENGVGIDSSFWYPQIYTLSKNDSRLQPNANNYSIMGKARGEAGISNTISLGFNLVQGSVVIKVGELVLTPNIDYTVDYSTGTVVIRNTSALLSKDLKVSYETNDLFTLASKTFLGLRGDYKISEKSSVGFTFVNLKQETLNDKVRIGEEPTNNSMFGIDFSTEVPVKMLTNLVNLLPGFNTKEASSITLRGEIASILPDPNTKKSLIPGDNNEAVAYIDDMEGAKKIISLGTTYNSWTISSVPLDESIGFRDSLQFKQRKRGKMKWYNLPNSELLTNIYPLKSVQANQNTITPFFMSYIPTKRGTYNYNGDYETITNLDSTWNGVMKFLNTTSNDLINENINFIEFSMRVENLNPNTIGGKLMIDLGNISQDAIPNGELNTEDTLGNGELRSEADDKGLDFKNDGEELIEYNNRNGTNLSLQNLPDPALDNNNTNPVFDENLINGTEGNLDFDNGRRPDTEDLNKTVRVNNGNDYFQFEISLDTSAANPYIVGRGLNGWHQYKIPLSQFTKAYGNASFNNIQFTRMWLTGLKDSVRLNMYEINLTGNQWVKPVKTDTTYNISVVSIEENPNYYQSPVPGDVLRQTVRGQNSQDTKSNEQSLSLEITNLTSGVRKVARKDFSTLPLDLFNYRSMKMFVNGDPSFNYTNDQIYDAIMVIRFGNDSNNYYEYRAPVHPDNRNLNRPAQPWDSLNNVTINFNELTKLKLARDSSNVPVSSPVANVPGGEYRIFGNPDLKSIREIIMGIEKNRSGLNSSISGSVWFNELRLVNVIDDDGIAFNVNANVKLADLMDFNFAIAKTDPFFHSLDTRVGSRNTGLSWDFSTTINVHKFINNALASAISENWKDFITLPLTFRHSETMNNPRYFPGTDIEIDRAADQRYQLVLAQTGNTEQAQIAKDNVYEEAQSLVIRNNLTISSMYFTLPGSNFFVKNIFNQLRFNFNADFGNSRDITYERKNDFRYNGGVSFSTDFGISEKLNLDIGKLIPLGEQYSNAKLYFFLPFIPLIPLFSSNITAGTDFTRSRFESKQRQFVNDDLTSRDFRANRGFRLDWKFIENWIVDLTGNYDFRAGSDLTPYEVSDTSGTQRPDSEIFNDIFFNGGVVNFGKDLDYVQTVTINPKISLPYVDKFFTVTGGYNVRYGWINPNQIINVGYNTGFSNTFNATGNIKLNELFSIFSSSENGNLRANGMGRGNGRDTIDTQNKSSQSLADILNIFKTLVPKDINVTYSQNNTVSNAGVTGNPGFGNFWFYPTTQEKYGPSRLYQLGFSQYPGTRAPNLSQLTDTYLHGNELSFSTSINPLLPENITMSLNFKTNWGFTNNLVYTSDEIGNIGSPTSKTSSLLSGNSIFFSGNMENFEFQGDANNTVQSRAQLTSAFEDQISSFPFPNWTLSISGLEKFPLFSEFASQVSVENNFISEYRESRLIDINSIDIPNSQAVTQAFSPLLGLNVVFKEILGGNMTTNFRINSSISNILNPIGASVQSIGTSEWSVNANFTKSGFSIPLFGLSLQNDIAFALTFSNSKNEPVNYEFGSGVKVPVTGNGSTVTTINPSVQYSLSSKVSMQLFYKYISTKPTGTSVTTVPRSSNEGGLNIRITIQ
ncbi:MAG: cell surface protein SprA [Ignavibacteria bacterium]|nr:cell surface protein SprA [Ignavibacteria bacterium]